MSYGGFPYGGVGYAGSDVGEIPTTDTEPTLAVEVAFTTDALEEPAWVDITGDVRFWDVQRGRNRELERFQPGRATVVLSNLSRQYDSVYVDGPWYGFIKPMRRIRIRETFNGVTYPTFDGYIDKWQLDYPGTGKDATATVTATDAFKIFARTDLPDSVYQMEVETSDPLVWWKLDENLARLFDGEALNAGSAGSSHDGSFVGSPRVGGPALVVNDPGTSLETTNASASPGTPLQGVSLDNSVLSVLGLTSFSLEAWVRMDEGGSLGGGHFFAVSRPADDAIHAAVTFVPTGAGDTGFFRWLVFNSAFTLTYGVKTPDLSVVPHAIHHVVASVESGGQMAIWLDGVRYVDAASGVTSTSLSGVTRPTGGHLQVSHENSLNADGLTNWLGGIAQVAVHSSQLGDARIAAHYAAGTAPWQGDLPGVRIGRTLDEAGWPSARRELDAGITTLQSAEIAGQSVLEHSQKVSESEYVSLFFISRDGKARFIGRTAVLARAPYPITFGDNAGEIGYTEFVPDDGDEVIRNRATISRLNGVAKTAEDAASVSEFGRFDYKLEGLLHSTDEGATGSQGYADFVVDEYASQRRRITSISLGPAIVGDEDIVYPAMLGLELGDAIVVSNTPQGLGSAFTQTCAIEDMRHAGSPGGVRTATFTLSPELVTI